MRTIRIPPDVIRRMLTEPIQGRAMLFAVQVDWPELRLTEEQVLANAAWAMEPHRTSPRPFPDPSVFDIEIPYVREMFNKDTPDPAPAIEEDWRGIDSEDTP